VVRIHRDGWTAGVLGLLGEDRADGGVSGDELGAHIREPSWGSVDAGVFRGAEPGVEQYRAPPGGDRFVVGSGPVTYAT